MKRDIDHKAKKWLLAFLSPYGREDSIPQDHETWAAILNIADRGLVLPRLAISLSERRKELRPDVREYLELSLELNRLRNGEIRTHLLSIIDRLNEVGIVPCVMKGAVTLLDKEVDIGWRMMRDIDILVPNPTEQDSTISCLRALGYNTHGAGDYSSTPHYPPFYLDGVLRLRVELHHRMAHPQFESTIDEEDAVSSMIECEFDGRRYRRLSDMNCVKLSYAQCRLGCQQGRVTIMKWIDLLDRCKAIGLREIAGPWQFGLRTNGDEIDARLLTSLSEVCQFPYTGQAERTFIEKWDRSYSEKFLSRFAQDVLRNAFDPEKWANKSLSEIWQALKWRVQGLPDSYKKAKNRDRNLNR